MAEQKTKPQAKAEKKSGGNKGLLIGFIILLLITNGVIGYLFYDATTTIEARDKTITENEANIKNLEAEVQTKLDELNAAKAEIEKLNGDVTSLNEQIAQLEADLEKQKKDKNYFAAKYNQIKNNIDAANKARDEAYAERDRLKAQLTETEGLLTEAKQTIVAREDSLSRVSNEKNKLAEKVAIASELKASKFVIEARSSKNKTVAIAPLAAKAKKVSKIIVRFALDENKVAETGGRDVFLRIIEPSGSALFDLASGGGSFQVDGKETFYTLKQNVLYDKKEQLLSFEYEKGSEYAVGNYKIEVYCEGKLIGSSNLVTK